MKTARIFALLFAAAGTLLLPAAETDLPDGGVSTAPEARENGRSSGGGRGGRGGFNPEAMQKYRDEIKAKFPAEYAELETLQQTDRRAAMTKMRELAEKAGIESPFGSRGDRRRDNAPVRDEAAEAAEAAVKAAWQRMIDQLKEKFPEEYAGIEKLQATDPAAALEKLRALAAKAGIEVPQAPAEVSGRPRPVSLRNGNRMMIARANRMLRQIDPEGYAALEKLRQEDEDAAREKLRAMVRSAGIPLELLRRHDYRDDDNLTVINQDSLTGIAAAAAGNNSASGSNANSGSGRRFSGGGGGGREGGPGFNSPGGDGNPPPPPNF